VFVEVLDRMAQRKGVSKAQLALAWLLHQNDSLTAIPGTRNSARLEENWGALQIELNATELAEIRTNLPENTRGARY